MTRFLVPAGASVVVGLLLGAASIFGVTLMIQQDTKPPLSAGDPASSVLNRVEPSMVSRYYGYYYYGYGKESR